MSVLLAQKQAADLRTALLDNGVQWVSLELQPGVAGSGWAVNTFRRGLGHHIASYPPGTPGLGLVKAGRTGKNALTGPLCNGYGGFDLVARIITMGWANHPGAGGPWPVAGWGTVPKNDGRPRIFGWEFEGGYLPYTDEMHDFMARCGAGTLDWLGTLPVTPGPAPIECWDEHKGWAPGRKSDRIGYSTASGRNRIAAVRGTRPTPTPALIPRTPLEDDVPTFYVQPGEARTLPATTKDSDLLVACDNPTGATVKLAGPNGPDTLIEGADLRIAVQRADRTWHPVDRPGFPVNPAEPFHTAVPVGASGTQLTPAHGQVLGVSVLNTGHLPVTVTLAPHPV